MTTQTKAIKYKGYDIAKRKGKWYVTGHCGGKYWMIVSDAYNTKHEAIRRIAHQKQADASMKREIRDGNYSGVY